MQILISRILIDADIDRRSSFSFPGGGFGQNVIIFGVDMSSAHIDNKKKDILVLGKGPTQGLDIP